MVSARRRVTVLIAGSAVALSTAVAATGSATAATGASGMASRASVVRSCSRAPAPGHATCFALRRTDISPVPRAAASASTPGGYRPADLRSAYKLPSTTRGTGLRVYIIDAYNDPSAESDLGVYRSRFGLPACTTANGCFRKLNQHGSRSPLPAASYGWSQEISLDLDMVSAICPDCGITLMEAKNDLFGNLMTAAATATDLGAKFVSMSFGGAELKNRTSFDSKAFAASGVVYTAATGDSGYGVQYPASSTRVVAVGGTSLHRAANARGWSETAWSGTGSGCSAHEAKPSWQDGISSCARRAVADVSAVADPRTGVAVYLTTGGSGWAVFGGTSVGAPIIASAYALAGKPPATRKPPAVPYAHRGELFDVTSGHNGECGGRNLCVAGRGWDGPTGLGTPDGVGAFGG